MRSRDSLKLSIVTPMLNEEETASTFLEILTHECAVLGVGSWEIIVIDDGSSDSTPDILRTWALDEPRIRVLTLSRNFGHQPAISAGIAAASGDAVVVMDSDMQDPPGLISGMIDRWVNGADVVYAVRKTRAGESVVKRGLAAGFYRLLNRMSDISIPTDVGDFRLMGRPVVNALNDMPERDRYIRGMVAWSGFVQEPLYFDRPERHAGEPKYSFTKSLRLAVAGVVGFSDKPLFAAIWLGFFALALAVLGVLWIVVSALVGWGEQLRGWSSLAVLILFFSSVQLIFLGIAGLYISRIFMEAKHRPLYLIKSDSASDQP